MGVKVSDKIKSNPIKYELTKNSDLDTIKEIEINETDSDENFKEKNKIFIKKNIYDSNGSVILRPQTVSASKYINLENMKIIDSGESNKDNKIQLKKEMENFIINNLDEEKNNVVFIGGGKKSKIEIKQIDDKYKMKFDNEYSTLTEQNVNLNDEKTIKKIRHRKYMRHNREKNKLVDLRDIQ